MSAQPSHLFFLLCRFREEKKKGEKKFFFSLRSFFFQIFRVLPQVLIFSSFLQIQSDDSATIERRYFLYSTSTLLWKSTGFLRIQEDEYVDSNLIISLFFLLKIIIKVRTRVFRFSFSSGLSDFLRENTNEKQITVHNERQCLFDDFFVPLFSSPSYQMRTILSVDIRQLERQTNNEPY